MSNQPRMVSGIQPTNKITLGNYLGAIKNFVKYQDEYNMYVFVADLHALTTNTVVKMWDNKISVAKTYLAAGLDPKKVVIFNQSDVQEHTLLGYILTCSTTIGELNRMTQFKDKSAKCKSANGTEFIPTGLLIYPTQMAADILLYDANEVIVGQDQKQHLELTRNIAIRLNNATKSNLFTVPEFKTAEFSAKVMDLLDPTKKMSKSSENPKGVIFINDDIETTRKKIMGSLTDNFNKVKYDWDNQPGVSNLISIYASITEKSAKFLFNNGVIVYIHLNRNTLIDKKFVISLSDFNGYGIFSDIFVKYHNRTINRCIYCDTESDIIKICNDVRKIKPWDNR